MPPQEIPHDKPDWAKLVDAKAGRQVQEKMRLILPFSQRIMSGEIPDINFSGQRSTPLHECVRSPYSRSSGRLQADWS